MTEDEEERQPVLVVNTHLFYHPMASHIRMLQVAAILDEVRRLKRHCPPSSSSLLLSSLVLSDTTTYVP